jgi:hypothetical protein
MAATPTHYYEELLCHYSDHLNAVELLRQYRPYLETVPSMRRSEESLITIPLPLIQVRRETEGKGYSGTYEKLQLPCDLAIIMCDPEWQVKTDVEIFIFIHHPEEDFSGMLRRWRQTQMLLTRDYSWDMPLHKQEMYSEGAHNLLPLFVLLEDTPTRIQRGMQGSGLPFVIETFSAEGQLNPKPNSEETHPNLAPSDAMAELPESVKADNPTPALPDIPVPVAREMLNDLWLPESLEEQESWLAAHLPDYVQECPDDPDQANVEDNEDDSDISSFNL